MKMLSQAKHKNIENHLIKIEALEVVDNYAGRWNCT
jgi:hypothetical protein